MDSGAVTAAGGEDQEIAETIEEGFEDLIDGGALGEEGVHGFEGVLGMAIGDGGEEISHQLAIGEAQEVLEEFEGEVFFAGSQEAIEEGKGIAHGAIGEGGDGVEEFGLGGVFFLLEDDGEVLDDLIDGDVAEVVALAAGLDGWGNFVGIGGAEDELDVFGGLFHGFEKSVEGLGGEHVDFVDDVDFVRATEGAVGGIGDEFASTIDTGVGGGVDLDDIGVAAGHDGGFDFFTFVAVEGFGEDAGGGGFTHAAGSGEEIGVGETIAGDGVLEGAGDGFLADEIIEGLRAVAAGEDGVGHGGRVWRKGAGYQRSVRAAKWQSSPGPCLLL